VFGLDRLHFVSDIQEDKDCGPGIVSTIAVVRDKISDDIFVECLPEPNCRRYPQFCMRTTFPPLPNFFQCLSKADVTPVYGSMRVLPFKWVRGSVMRPLIVNITMSKDQCYRSDVELMGLVLPGSKSNQLSKLRHAFEQQAESDL
jgi:hypothetical protein